VDAILLAGLCLVLVAIAFLVAFEAWRQRSLDRKIRKHLRK
jgi:hypothetical protein